MILSYESLIQRWIKNKDYKSILIMCSNANQDVAHFIDRDIVDLLIAAEKTGCTKTIAAIIKCSIPRRLLEIRSEFEIDESSDDVDNELFGIDAPSKDKSNDKATGESHDLILLVLDKYLNSDNFAESMLKVEYGKYLENESSKFI